MPFPSGLTLVTVHGRFDTLPGTPQGFVRFVSTSALLGATDNSVVPYVDESVSLVDGEFTKVLPATNDPDWTPQGWAYTVTINLGVRTITGTLQLDYQTTSVEFADLLQPDGATETGQTYIPLSERGTAGGVASLGDDGLVPASQLPVGGGGSGVSSVNTRTGAVVLTATDVTDSSSTGRSVMTAASPAAARSAIGAGTSSLVIGTSAGTAAEGNDGRLSNARTPTAHASSHGVGQSDDISASYVPWANVGSPGGVADYSDARITGAQQRSTLTTKGDLYVATASATVARVGVGADGQVLTADAAQTAGVKWATPSGGGGSSMVVKRGVVTSGDITPPADGGSWAIWSAAPQIVIAAAVGDYVSIEACDFMLDPTNSGTFFDWVVIVSAAIVRSMSTHTNTPAVEGSPAFYIQPSTYRHYGPAFEFVVASGDLSGGNVTVGWAHKGTGTGTLFASSNYPFRWRAINYGPISVS